MLSNLESLDVELREEVMTKLLLELHQLAASDRAILDQLSMTAFVATGSGRLQPPTALYDPRWVPIPTLHNHLPAWTVHGSACCITSFSDEPRSILIHCSIASPGSTALALQPNVMHTPSCMPSCVAKHTTHNCCPSDP